MVSAQNLPLIFRLLLTVACVVVYGELGSHSFVRWDDGINVYQNPYLNPVTPAHLAHFWTGIGMNQAADTVYRPLVYTVYALISLWARTTPFLTDSQVALLNPRAFHAVSLVFHIANALLVFGLLRRLVRSDPAALAGAALFALHPVQVESVAWVTGLTDLMGAFFSLLALGTFLRYRESGARGWFGLATLWFGLALLSKPSAVTLPLVMLALDHWLLGRSWREGLKLLAAWLPLAAASVWITHLAEPVLASGVVTSWQTRPLIAGDALALSLKHLIWPTSLGIDYGRSPDVALAHGAWLSSLVVLGLGVCVWSVRRRFPWLMAGAAIFAAALLPTLGLVPFRFQTYSTVADRYLYFALLGPALALAVLLSRLPKGLSSRVPLAAGTACAAVLLLMGFGSVLQVTYWQNSAVLFRHAIDTNPRSWMAHYNLGSMAASLGHREEAASEFQQALRLKPDFAAQDAYQYGLSLAHAGRKTEAAAEFRRALDYQPNFAPAREALRASP